MKIPIEIGGRSFMAETAAISCVRYRSRYGVSPVAMFSGAEANPDFRAGLAKLLWVMVCAEGEISFEEFAMLCADRDTVDIALKARGALLMRDEKYSPPPNTEFIDPGEFDEFDLLAKMAVAGLPEGLMYELTILQLDALLGRTLEYKNNKAPRHKYVKLSVEEVTRQSLGTLPKRPEVIS